jgi:hypothetical protein
MWGRKSSQPKKVELQFTGPTRWERESFKIHTTLYENPILDNDARYASTCDAVWLKMMSKYRQVQQVRDSQVSSSSLDALRGRAC